MANDRIFMRCHECNDVLLLTKYYPPSDIGELHHEPGAISQWISTHLRHNKNIGRARLYGHAGIEIITESEEQNGQS